MKRNKYSADLTSNAQGADLDVLIKTTTNKFYNLRILEDRTFSDPGFIHLLIEEVKAIADDQNRIDSLADEIGTSPECIIKILEQMQLTQTNILGVIEHKSDL